MANWPPREVEIPYEGHIGQLVCSTVSLLTLTDQKVLRELTVWDR